MTKSPKIIEDGDIDSVTRTMLERAGLLRGDLPTRVTEFFFVLTGFRVDLVRIGNGEYDDNQPGAAGLLRQGLELWKEFEPKARVSVNDLRNHAGEWFSIWPLE